MLLVRLIQMATVVIAWSCLICCDPNGSQRQPAEGDDQPRVTTDSLVGTPLSIDDQGNQLYGVSSATVLADGSVAVVAGRPHRLLLFGPDGGRPVLLGAQGSGPREYRHLELLRAYGDTLLAYDALLHRVQIWVGARHQQSVRFGMSPTGAALQFVDSWNTSTWLLTARKPLGVGGAGVFRDSLTAYRFSVEDEALEPIGTFVGPERLRFIQGDGMTEYNLPFGHRTHLRALGENAVVSSDGDSIWVWKDGQLTATICPEYAPALEGSMLQPYVDSLTELAAPPYVERIRLAFDQLDDERRLPRVADLLVIGNRIAAREHPRPGSDTKAWRLYAPDGRLVERVLISAPLVLFAGASGRVAYLTTDDMGLQAIFVARGLP